MVFIGLNNINKPLGFDELQLVAMVHGQARPVPNAESESESHTNENLDEHDIPNALRLRPEDQTRYHSDKEGFMFYYKSIVRLVCRATSLPSKDDDFRAKLEGDKLKHAEALERQADTVRELELQLEEQVRLQVEAETETRHSIVMTEVGAELSQADAEQPENPQAMGLMEERIRLERQLAELNFPSEDWVEQRLRSTRQKLDDVMYGVEDVIPDVVEGRLAAAMNMGWAVLSVAGAYQLLWRLREERDTLLQHNIIEDSSVRKLLFSFLGLQQAYEGGRGKETALALFATLAKTHGAAGADVVPDTYQAYYVICAQLFGTDKANALLNAPLTDEEVSEMECTELTGMYESDFMHEVDADDNSWLDERWTPEALRAVHLRRLRAPWGRLYVKELSKLREVLALLEAPLPDVDAYKAIVKQRLDEVRERLGALESTLEHVLPSPSSSPRAVPASPTAAPTGAVLETNPTTPATAKEAVRNGWWWRRVLQWLSRLRGSLASKLRKLRERLTGKTSNSSASHQDQAPEATTTPGIATLRQSIATLRQSLEVARRELYTHGTYLKATRTRQELDDWTVDQLENMGLGREGLLCQTLETLAKSTWDLQDDVAALRSDRAPTAKDKLACMLLRVCYIDVPGFFALARRDKGQCQSLMKTAFKKGFKLRRKGHTDRVSNLRGLSNEEKGLLTGLCAGMDNAQDWLADRINRPFFASIIGTSD